MTANDANEKAEKVATLPASNAAFDKANSTLTDPLGNWFALAKPCRDRQKKTGWKRGRK